MDYEKKSTLYKLNYEKIDELEAEGYSSFYDHTEKRSDYWTVDHNVMKHFETIEEIEAPTDWSDFKRIEKGFLYHSQYIEYNSQCYELVRTKLGEYLDELFFILSRTNAKNNASQKQYCYDKLSQGIRHKQNSN